MIQGHGSGRVSIVSSLVLFDGAAENVCESTDFTISYHAGMKLSDRMSEKMNFLIGKEALPSKKQYKKLHPELQLSKRIIPTRRGVRIKKY
jgi:hypothetical protein